MGLFGVPLNPANMIAFPLILGVGVDNGVHVLHDYLLRRGEQGGDDQLRHRPRRAGQGADDDDRLRHADDFQRARPGGPGLDPDARRRLFDADGAGVPAGRAAPASATPDAGGAVPIHGADAERVGAARGLVLWDAAEKDHLVSFENFRPTEPFR